MKNRGSIYHFISLGVLLISTPLILLCQTPNNQDCLGAIPVCRELYIQNNSYSGTGNYPNEINGASSCLTTGEVNDVWYRFNVTTSGVLSFTIIPNDPSDDYDWAVFNLSNNECDEIFFNPSLQISCNYEANTGNGGITGPNGGSNPQEENTINVTAGQTYVINVSNYSSTQNGYSLTFAASTASIYDNTPPALASIIGTPTCNDNQFEILFSEEILCSSIDIADFELIGPNGPIAIQNLNSNVCNSGGQYDHQFTFTVPNLFSDYGNYQLNLVGSVSDLCNNSVEDGSLSFFINAPSATVSTVNSDCNQNNGSATIQMNSGQAPFSFQWDDPGNQTTSTAGNLFAGLYDCNITDNQGCSLTINDVWIPNNNPIIQGNSVINNPSCNGTSDGSISLEINSGIGPFQYLWNDDMGQTDSVATGLPSGTYTVQVSAQNGCVDFFTFELTDPSDITITSSNDTLICFGSFATLEINATGGNAPYNYLYNTTASVFNTIQVSPPADTYFYTQVIDNNGCLSPLDSVLITINTPISVDITSTDTIVCSNQNFTLTAIPSGGINGPYYYDWGNGYQDSPNYNLSINQDTVIQVSVTDDCPSITGYDEINISTFIKPEISYSVDQEKGCEPITAHFTFESDSVAIQNIYWSANNTIINSAFEFDHTFSANTCIDIGISIVDTNNCIQNFNDDCALSVFPLPNTTFSTIPEIATILNPFFSFIDLTDDAVSWEWEFGDGSSSSEQYPLHVYPDTGRYEVCLKTTNQYGCSKSFCHEVYIDYIYSLYVPNAFSPNNDYINDQFSIAGEGFEKDQFDIKIYDRWGILLFQSNNPDFIWDGKFQNKTVPEDVYVYIINLVDYKNEEHRIHGHVTVVR